jgi:multiple sugar transport system substrate-binding protein
MKRHPIPPITTGLSRRTRRALAGHTAALSGSTLLAACGPFGQGGPETKQLAPATLTYTTWWIPPLVYGTATEKAIQGFESRHPGVKVRIEGLTGTAAQGMEKVQTMAAAGTPPDISLLRPQYPGTFAAKGMLRAIDDQIQKDRRAARGDFMPVAIDRTTWKGKLWGLPAEIWFLTTFYNPAIFSRAGQAPPNENWTWDTWLDAARKLSTSAQEGSFVTDDPAWEMLVWAWGGEILNKQETECLLAKSPAPEALQWRADLTHKHHVVATAQERQNAAFRNLFEEGRLGMLTIGNWALTDVQKAAQMPWNVALVPRGRTGRATLSGGANYAIFQESKSHDAAWTLMADLVAGDGMKVLAAESSLLPPVQSLIKQELLPTYKPEWLKVVVDSSKSGRQPHYNHPRYAEINQTFGEQLGPVWQGRRSAKEAADEIVRLVNPLLV